MSVAAVLKRGSQCVAQAALRLAAPLSQAPKAWNYR